MNNVIKEIYKKYNNNNERIVDIIVQIMKDKNLSVEEMVEILKQDQKLLNIYKTECEVFKLLKGNKNCGVDLSNIF